jgi:Lon protease-like protein
MIRRAIESQDGFFGMCAPEEGGTEEGGTGFHFHTYGCLLRIGKCDFSPDGRSLVETQGMRRFKVRCHVLSLSLSLSLSLTHTHTHTQGAGNARA